MLSLASLTVLCSGPARATPVTYTASVVTDVKIGKTFLHNAAVTLSFQGNTSGIQPVLDTNGQPLASTLCPTDNQPADAGPSGTGPYFFYLPTGRASLRLESNGQVISTRFLPKQLFVAFDTCNGGVGFGSFTGPQGFEPVYPLSLTGGTAMSFMYNTPNPLATSVNVSGYAWSCIGFPNVHGVPCPAPDGWPLKTEAGDVFFYMPYQEPQAFHFKSLNQGLFSILIRTDD